MSLVPKRHCGVVVVRARDRRPGDVVVVVAAEEEDDSC